MPGFLHEDHDSSFEILPGIPEHRGKAVDDVARA
jgi:hypothetical protein